MQYFNSRNVYDTDFLTPIFNELNKDNNNFIDEDEYNGKFGRDTNTN